jgi:hypothetical protein
VVTNFHAKRGGEDGALTTCAGAFHASSYEDYKDRQRQEAAMNALQITLIASTVAFLFGSASVASDLALGADLANSRSQFNCDTDTNRGDPDAPEGYSKLGIAKINGRRVAVYSFQNGAKPDDAAGEGRGFADVFDSGGHLIRRFSFRENLNSPPRITEYIPLPAD